MMIDGLSDRYSDRYSGRSNERNLKVLVYSPLRTPNNTLRDMTPYRPCGWFGRREGREVV